MGSYSQNFNESQNYLESLLEKELPGMFGFADIQVSKVIAELQTSLPNPSGGSKDGQLDCNATGQNQLQETEKVETVSNLDEKQVDLHFAQNETYSYALMIDPTTGPNSGESEDVPDATHVTSFRVVFNTEEPPHSGQSNQIVGQASEESNPNGSPGQQLHQFQLQSSENKPPLCEENFEVEPKSLPGINFQVKIANLGRDIHYFYSDILEMYYTGMKNPLTYEMSFVKNPDLPNHLVVRVYWVIPSKPYKRLSRVRCTNEYHMEDTQEPANHIVTLEQGGPVEYVGSPDGMSPKDRLALVIPMGDSSRKSIALKFRCLSSCSNASKNPTALVFTLVDPVSGQLFGREVIPIKVTINVKRDMEAAEKAAVLKQHQPSSVVGGGQKRKQLISSDGRTDWRLFKVLVPSHSMKYLHEAYKSVIANELANASEPNRKMCFLGLAEMEKQAADLDKPKDK